MIVVTADFQFQDASARSDAVAAAVPLQQATRDDEPGCVAYVFAADPANDDRLMVFELWEDETSLAAHFEHENYLRMGSMLRGAGLKGGDAKKWRIVAAEPVYDETPRARADFFTEEVQAPDQPIVVAGIIDMHDPDDRAPLLEASIPHQLATRDDEPGCRMYVFAPDPCVEGRIAVCEVWDDQASLAAHFDHENYRNMAGVIRSAPGGYSSDNRKYRADVFEPVYDPTFTPRADFFTI